MRTLCIVILSGVLAVASHATERWALLRPGMDRASAAAAVGLPLFHNSAHRFEVWIFDRGGEVVLLDQKVWAWSLPVRATSAISRAGSGTLAPPVGSGAAPSDRGRNAPTAADRGRGKVGMPPPSSIKSAKPS